jgi:hypothetical protein
LYEGFPVPLVFGGFVRGIFGSLAFGADVPVAGFSAAYAWFAHVCPVDFRAGGLPSDIAVKQYLPGIGDW